MSKLWHRRFSAPFFRKAARVASGAAQRERRAEARAITFSRARRLRHPAAGATAVPLQQAKQAQSISLPNGAGRTSFRVFRQGSQEDAVREIHRRVRRTGGLADALLSAHASLPAVGASTLNAVRSLVANLQAHGENQQWIMMSTPTDVATTQAAAQSCAGRAADCPRETMC